MEKDLDKIKEQCLKDIAGIKCLKDFDDLKIKYLGRKGEMNKILKEISKLNLQERKIIGKLANDIKQEIEDILNRIEHKLKDQELGIALEKEWIDVSQPILGAKKVGHQHPLTQVQIEIEDIFRSMGFMILDGPELESEYYNFEALNIPAWHPARDMQDTFYISSKFKVQSSKLTEDENRLVMRTHTSPVQVRAMQKFGAPLKSIAPGRVFRNEATDASHDHTFYQVEGLMVDRDISIANLIATMKTLLKAVFKKDVKARLRPGYFPFVEPGFELDVNCLICGGKGCSVCKHTGWVELMPCGMVHPNVLRYGGIDPDEYAGFAFGLGLTRLVMMKYGIDDIRLLLSGDLRFLKQF